MPTTCFPRLIPTSAIPRCPPAIFWGAISPIVPPSAERGSRGRPSLWFPWSATRRLMVRGTAKSEFARSHQHRACSLSRPGIPVATLPHRWLASAGGRYLARSELGGTDASHLDGRRPHTEYNRPSDDPCCLSHVRADGITTLSAWTWSLAAVRCPPSRQSASMVYPSRSRAIGLINIDAEKDRIRRRWSLMLVGKKIGAAQWQCITRTCGSDSSPYSVISIGDGGQENCTRNVCKNRTE
jgi:hypothetical protein